MTLTGKESVFWATDTPSATALFIFLIEKLSDSILEFLQALLRFHGIQLPEIVYELSSMI